MTLFSIAPESVVAVIVLIALAWLFEDRVGFNKGVILNPYEWILKQNRIYFRRRRAVSNVTHLIFQNSAPILAEIRKELASDEFKDANDAKQVKEIQSAFNKVDLESVFHDENFGLQAFVLGGLLRSPMLLYVISRKKDEKTGDPRPFPSGQELVASRPVISGFGLRSRGLVEGNFVLLPKKQAMEGLFRRAVTVGLFVSDDDSRDPDLISWMEKIAPALQTVAIGVRTEIQFGIIVKDLLWRLKESRSEVKVVMNDMRTLKGRSMADTETANFYRSGLPNSKKITNAFTPVAMFGFPIFGAAVFQYVLHSNAIFGVIVGGSLAMVVIGTRRS